MEVGGVQEAPPPPTVPGRVAGGKAVGELGQGPVSYRDTAHSGPWRPCHSENLSGLSEQGREGLETRKLGDE